MAPRDVEIRTKLWVGPSRRLDDARHVRIRATEGVIEYPDDATAQEVADIVEEAARFLRVETATDEDRTG